MRTCLVPFIISYHIVSYQLNKRSIEGGGVLHLLDILLLQSAPSHR